MAEDIRCEEIEALAGAYALDAATPEEVAAIEAHLAGCDKHPEMADLVTTAHRLAALPDEIAPSPELKTRLMAAVNADLAAERASGPRPATPAERAGLLSRLFGGPRLGLGLAAAAVAAVVALLLVFSPFDGGDGDQTVVQTFGDIRVEVTYDPDGPDASMTVEGLDPAPSGTVYQVWAITDDESNTVEERRIASIGFLEVSEEGAASSEMDVQLSDGQVVAVTLEPEGGSPQPTTAPIFGVEI